MKLNMEDMEIMFIRALGNGATAFFTIMAGLNFAGMLNEPNALLAAFLGAFMQAGLATAQEVKRWAEGKEPKRGKGEMFLIM